MYKIFIILSCLGVMLIICLAFIIPVNPYQKIPSFFILSFEKPLWLNIILVSCFFYLHILYTIYDKLIKKYII